jgi:signal transduction histidine kinase
VVIAGQEIGWLVVGALAGWGAGYFKWRQASQVAVPTVSASLSAPSPELTDTLEPSLPLSVMGQALGFSESFKSAFWARSAHELRSPLNSVIGLHQLILEDLCEDPQEEREFVGQAKDATLKMLRLLDTLVTVSRLQSGREVPKLEPTPLHSIFSDVQELMLLIAANRNLGLKVDLPPTDWLVYTDAQWLRFLLIAWLDFAIANQTLGILSIWSELSNQTHIVIYVQMDIPMADLQSALDSINQGNIPETSTEAIDISQAQSISLSSGLTLAISQQIITALGGQLTLTSPESEEAQSILRCVLPRANA